MADATIIGADGQHYSIPAENLQAALAIPGTKQAVATTGPDGNGYWLPIDRVKEAVEKNGFKVGQPSAQDAAPDKAGFGRSLAEGVGGDFSKSWSDVGSNLKEMVTHPIESLYTVGNAASDAQAAEFEKGFKGSPAHFAYGAIPVVGPVLGRAATQMEQGNIAGGLGSTTAATAQVYGAHPEVVAKAGAVADLPGKVADVGRGALAERMAQKAPGSQFTRGEVLQAAKDAGIKLDVAQATDHPVAKVVKKMNENSLLGNSTYEANRTANQSALENLADSQKGKLSPASADREVVGGQIQDALRKDLVQKKTAATEAFQDLDQRVGSNTIDATNTVEAQARQIISENKAYYEKHPELLPKQAWGIIKDLAERPSVQTPNPSGTNPDLVDALGNKVQTAASSTTTQAPKNLMKWSELHQLRSDLMDIYRNNPDIVKGQSERWLQTMVRTIDNAMTDSAGGLKGADLAQFRAANANWESIKATYDNPQSPLYQAIRTPYQSQVASMLSQATPELARQVRKTLGAVEGPFQRQFVEQIINSKDGATPDFKNLATKLRRIPADHLEAMIGKEGAKNLRMLGELSQKVTSDSNPSGTAKVGQPAAEAAGAIFHPATGVPELVAQYGAAKAMNSPRVLEYLTSPATKAMLERSGWVRDASGRWVRGR